MHLLLIEDNSDLAELLASGLARHDFRVDRFGTMSDAAFAIRTAHYDVILLDLGLPDGDGLDLVRALRAEKNPVPILIITARDGLGDRLKGLDGGADDYLVKPFAIAELAARCRALLRRPGACLGVTLTSDNVSLDTVRRTLEVAGRCIAAPPREVTLLEIMLRHAGEVLTRERLISSLYAFGEDVTDNALDAVMSRLRRRLGQAGATVRLTTVYGVGYALFGAGRS